MKASVASILILVASAVLAGCSDAPPSGDLQLSPGQVKADGTATVTYVSFQDPLRPDANQGDPGACVQDQVPGIPPAQRCRYPSTTIEVMFPAEGLDLPDPTVGYSVFAVGSADGPLAVGASQAQPTENGWTFNNTFDVDLEGNLTAIELRMGDVVVASAPATGGAPNSFAPNPALQGISGEGTFRGRQLDLVLSGIPQNITAVGWLVATDEAGAQTHEVSFQVANGEIAYEAERNIAEFSEVHIHVGGSKINVAKAPIGS